MARDGILNAFYVFLFLEISAAIILCENSLELSAAAVPAMKDAGWLGDDDCFYEYYDYFCFGLLPFAKGFYWGPSRLTDETFVSFNTSTRVPGIKYNVAFVARYCFRGFSSLESKKEEEKEKNRRKKCVQNP